MAFADILTGISNFLQPIAPILQVGGTLLSAYGQRKAGVEAEKASTQAASNEQAMAEFEALQHERMAGEAQREAQMRSAEYERQAQILASNALAAAAGSGAGASDPTVVELMSRIAGEGSYRAQLALYEGEKEARNRQLAAQARRAGAASSASALIAEGRARTRAGTLAAGSTLLQGVGSWAERYSMPSFRDYGRETGNTYANWGLSGPGDW